MLPEGRRSAEGPYAAPIAGRLHRRRSIAAGGIGLAAQLYRHRSEEDAVVSTRPRSRAARPPRHADRLRPAAARAWSSSQGEAIRARDVDAVLARLADIQTEMGRRGAPRAGPRRAAAARRRRARRARPPGHARAPLRARSRPGAAAPRRERSAELRGLLAEIAREHGINRALMRQELAFLSHLTRLDRPGARARLPPARPAPARRLRRRPRPPIHRALDLQA